MGDPCAAKTASGNRCKRPRRKDSNYCHVHELGERPKNTDIDVGACTTTKELSELNAEVLRRVANDQMSGKAAEAICRGIRLQKELLKGVGAGADASGMSDEELKQDVLTLFKQLVDSEDADAKTLVQELAA